MMKNTYEVYEGIRTNIGTGNMNLYGSYDTLDKAKIELRYLNKYYTKDKSDWGKIYKNEHIEIWLTKNNNFEEILDVIKIK